jgi:hypothetical protein
VLLRELTLGVDWLPLDLGTIGRPAGHSIVGRAFYAKIRIAYVWRWSSPFRVSGCRREVDGTAGLPSAPETACAPRQLRLVPIPDLKPRGSVRPEPTHCGRSLPPTAMAAHAPHRQTSGAVGGEQWRRVGAVIRSSVKSGVSRYDVSGAALTEEHAEDVCREVAIQVPQALGKREDRSG